MKLTDFELLQPVAYRNTIGYISFIDERYISICFIDTFDPTQRWCRHQAKIVVYREYWNEVRCCLDEAEKEKAIAPRSDLLQFGGCHLVGTTC